MVVFDTSVLTFAFDNASGFPIDPQTGHTLVDCNGRVEFLIEKLSTAKVRILVPTPVLSEYLVLGGVDQNLRLHEFQQSKCFLLKPFDVRAAVECALLEKSTGKGLSLDETKAKLKFDRQILAIGIANGASEIFTGDIKLAERAKKSGMKATLTWELPLRPLPPQMTLPHLSEGSNK